MKIPMKVKRLPDQFDRLHPVCDLSKAICKIMKRKTLRVFELRILHDMADVDVEVDDT